MLRSAPDWSADPEPPKATPRAMPPMSRCRMPLVTYPTRAAPSSHRLFFARLAVLRAAVVFDIVSP